jgi:hypothetical protein
MLLKLSEICCFHNSKIDHNGLGGNFQVIDSEQLRTLIASHTPEFAPEGLVN